MRRIVVRIALVLGFVAVHAMLACGPHLAGGADAVRGTVSVPSSSTTAASDHHGAGHHRPPPDAADGCATLAGACLVVLAVAIAALVVGRRGRLGVVAVARRFVRRLGTRRRRPAYRPPPLTVTSILRC